LNTTEGDQSLRDSKSIRRAAVTHGIPYYTTLSASRAAVEAIRIQSQRRLTVKALQSQQRMTT
jgi:carbamoyl-phosphate synthase large subunit